MTTTTDTTTTTAPRTMFAVIVNDAGYLPDADPTYCPTAADAVAALVDALRYDADAVWSAHDDDRETADDAARPYDDAADAVAQRADAWSADLAAWHTTGVAGVGVVVRTVYGADRSYSAHAVAADHDGAACCPSVVVGRGHDGAPWACE